MAKINDELLCEAKEHMCDDYCKYPMEYAMQFEDSEEAHEAMLVEVCADCPLNNL